MKQAVKRKKVINMEQEQLQEMLRIAREDQNLQELKRLQKIVAFHDPNFSYRKYKKKRRILGESFFEKAKRVNRHVM